MRKVVYGINITLDGCCDHTKMIADDEVHKHFARLLAKAGLLVYGRKTYQLMVPFWPEVAKSQSMDKAGNEFARVFDALPKVVFSRASEIAEERNTTVVRGPLAAEISKLKAQSGKDILVGGVDLPSQLIALGLVDEFHFAGHPVVAGEGTRLMEGVSLPERLQLKLVELKRFGSGCVALHYVQ